MIKFLGKRFQTHHEFEVYHGNKLIGYISRNAQSKYRLRIFEKADIIFDSPEQAREYVVKNFSHGY